MSEKEIAFYERRINLMEAFMQRQAKEGKTVVVLKVSTVEEIVADYRNMLEEAKADRVF